MALLDKVNKYLPSFISQKASVSEVDIECESLIDVSGWVGDLISSTSVISPRQALSYYSQSTIVSNPVNKIADAFMDTTFILKRKNGDTEEIIRDHPVLDLLMNPAPDYDEKLFKACMAIYYLLTGENFYIALGSGEPSELNPISPVNITHSKGPDGFVKSLKVSGDSFTGQYNRDQAYRGQLFQRDPLTQLIFIRNLSIVSNSQLRGQSRLNAAKEEILTSIAGVAHNFAILKNGGRVSMAINIKDELRTRDFEEAKDRIKAQVTGQNSGNVLVIDSADMDIKEYGTSNKDMDYQNMMKSIKETMYSTFMVPLTLASTDAATYNNLGVSYEALYDNAVIPLASRLCAGLDVSLLPRFNLDPTEYSLGIDIDAIPALRTRRLEELKLRVGINKETTNEYRELLGRDSVANGETIQQAATLVELGASGEDDPKDPSSFEVAE